MYAGSLDGLIWAVIIVFSVVWVGAPLVASTLAGLITGSVVSDSTAGKGVLTGTAIGFATGVMTAGIGTLVLLYGKPNEVEHVF